MKTFRDNAGREWAIEVTVAAVKRVRSLIQVDLLEAADGKLLEKLASDPVLLCDVVFCLVQPEAKARGISDEDFGRGLAGEAIERATAAFLEELVDFFPPARRRLLSKALGKLRLLETKAFAVAEKRLDSPELDQELERLLAPPITGG